jgi:hypothetical protein
MMHAMNKAFVREPEQSGAAHCPRCGSAGQAVGSVTLDAQLPAGVRGALGDFAWFCPFLRCDVVYFDDFERVVPTSEFDRPIYPKSPEAPICACFGLTTDDIERDVREGVVTRTKAGVQRANSAEAHCSTAAANGVSCVAEVQRCYMRLREHATKGQL